MAKSRNRGRKNTKRRLTKRRLTKRRLTKRRRRQLGRGLTSSTQPKPFNNTNAVKRALFYMPVYKNGEITNNTKPLDATLIHPTNDPFILQDDDETYKKYGPSYPGIDKASLLTSDINSKREEKRAIRENYLKTIQELGQSNKVPEWLIKE